MNINYQREISTEKKKEKKKRKATSVHKLSPDRGYVAALKFDQDLKKKKPAIVHKRDFEVRGRKI